MYISIYSHLTKMAINKQSTKSDNAYYSDLSNKGKENQQSRSKSNMKYTQLKFHQEKYYQGHNFTECNKLKVFKAKKKAKQAEEKHSASKLGVTEALAFMICLLQQLASSD